jgi:hypothetical protein
MGRHRDHCAAAFAAVSEPAQSVDLPCFNDAAGLVRARGEIAAGLRQLSLPEAVIAVGDASAGGVSPARRAQR